MYVFSSVSLVLKIRSEQGVGTQSTTSLWQDYLTSYGNQLLMDEHQIGELKAGLEFGKALRLPSELAFSTVQMCDLLICRKTVLSFEYLRLVSITVCACEV